MTLWQLPFESHLGLLRLSERLSGLQQGLSRDADSVAILMFLFGFGELVVVSSRKCVGPLVTRLGDGAKALACCRRSGRVKPFLVGVRRPGGCE